MKFSLEQDPSGNLVARQHANGWFRYGIGLTLLVWGGIMLYVVVSSFMTMLHESGILEALLISVVFLCFVAVLLPIGWWITVSTHWIVLEMGTQEIVQISDWKIGRKERRTPWSAFHAVRIALEPLDSDPNPRPRKHVTLCQSIRLLAKNPEHQPSIEIGALDRDAREFAVCEGQRIADVMQLPLQVASADAILHSPAREVADQEAMAEQS